MALTCWTVNVSIADHLSFFSLCLTLLCSSSSNNYLMILLVFSSHVFAIFALHSLHSLFGKASYPRIQLWARSSADLRWVCKLYICCGQIFCCGHIKTVFLWGGWQSYAVLVGSSLLTDQLGQFQSVSDQDARPCDVRRHFDPLKLLNTEILGISDNTTLH